MTLTGLVALAVLAVPTASYASAADSPGKGSASSPLTVTSSTQIPGKVLKKGAYTIRILDHLSDRMILQVDHNGKMLSTFLAVPSSSLQKSTAQGAITLNAGVGAKEAIRGFAFPDGTVAEFVYPKSEAVGLAKANDTKIPAIDPDSQGLKGNPALSATDREMVTLWMLSPTTVGPNDSSKAILAERYQAAGAVNASTAPSSSTTTDTAAAKNEVASGGSTRTTGAASQPARMASADTVPARPRAQRPAMTALPHTAGSEPLVLLSGLVAMAGAAVMARRRHLNERL